MRPFSLHIYKGNEKIGIRKGESDTGTQREQGNRYLSGTHVAKSVESVRSIIIYVLHAGIFLLDANMKSVLLFHLLVAIQSM
jgi:hypothetical protein